MAGSQAGVPLQAVGTEEPLPVSPWGWQCSAQPAALLGRLALLWGQEGGGPLFSDRAGQGQLGPVCLSCLHFNVKPFILACFLCL